MAECNALPFSKKEKMMETLELREIISKEWRTDDFIRKQLLCNKLKYSNQLRMHFILDYNINDYDGIAEEKYIKDDNESNIYLKTYLNKNAEIVDLVQTECEIKFVINAAQEQISCQLIYFFHRDADREELRRKKAIILETFSYEEFRRLVMHVGFDDFENYYKYKNYFTEIFKSSFLKAKSAEELKFLYSKAPEFVLQGMALENETLFGHLLALTKLDDTGIFSGWKDGSSALVNVLKAFPDHIFLLNKFRKSPELCNRIYFNLDGASEFNGEMKSNRLIFATILMQYCLFSYSRPKAGAPTFRIGNEYKVNTEVFGLAGDILGFGKSDEKTFFLQQQKEVTKRVFIVPKEGDPNATEQVTEDLDEGAEFYPLDMVYFIKQQTSETNEGEEQQGTIMMVPAIYVKAWADAEKWEDINETIRIVADMVGVVFGIGTLALSGNPYLLLAAAADLSLALPDLTIQAFRAEIAKLPGGDEFLRQWDLIYNVLGSAVAAPQLVVGLAQLTAAFYRSCLSLLRASVNVAENVKQGLRASAISVFLDLNSGTFQRKDLRMFSPTEWVIPSAGFISKTSECDALIQNGAFFIDLNINAVASKKEFGLVYNGKVIVKGNRFDKSYAGTLQNLKKVSHNVDKVKEYLDSLERFSNIQSGEAFKHLYEVLPLFNKKIIVVDGKEFLVEVSTTHCVNMVLAVDEYLKTGKISIALPSGRQKIEVLSTLYNEKYNRFTYFQRKTIPQIKINMKEGERGIIFGERTYPDPGHVFNIIKKDGELHFPDGQAGKGANLKDGFEYFKYLKIE
ncbi:hypothetical protein BBI00_16535 [Chryseobacterium arthrosphaerae]|uniref:Tox-PL domain-containing protein n=3 Tax=Chryseobacterium arthrosphaerae TaxID=651561 RepID=A0A1B8ZI81_9FLAO|nr:hypothetical protein BBI00_16535 [Chryseobacterium arthrosphaerae]